jgi:eukaryotic-like serine/threonine-protein kinase
VQTLADAPRGWGGSWNSDDVILFSPNMRWPLYRVPATGGGERVPVTSLASIGGGHDFPSFLPDGEHFVFTRRWPSEERGIYLGSLGAGGLCRLVAVDSPGVVTSQGLLLFAEEDVLKARALDVRGRRLEGDEVLLATDVLVQDAPGISVSRAGGVVAYRRGTRARTQLVWVDRSGLPIRTPGAPGAYDAPALSPDGNRVAVGRDGGIWVIDLVRGGAESLVAFHPAINFYPVWSPDGRHVVYASQRDGRSQLYRRLASGAGDEELLLESPDSAMPSGWSAARDLLTYFVGNTPDREGSLYALPMADPSPEPQVVLETPFNLYEHQISPDGLWMAYVSEESGIPQVYVQAFPASGDRWPISIAGGVQPMWRSDQQELFYLALDGRVMAVEVRTMPAFEAGVPHALFETNGPMLYARSSYVPRAGGQEFLVNAYIDGDRPTIGVIVNSAALVRG